MNISTHMINKDASSYKFFQSATTKVSIGTPFQSRLKHSRTLSYNQTPRHWTLHLLKIWGRTPYMWSALPLPHWPPSSGVCRFHGFAKCVPWDIMLTPSHRTRCNSPVSSSSPEIISFPRSSVCLLKILSITFISQWYLNNRSQNLMKQHMKKM